MKLNTTIKTQDYVSHKMGRIRGGVVNTCIGRIGGGVGWDGQFMLC